MDNILYNESEKTFYFECPHCKVLCEVKEEDIRCTIFRHAVYKKNSTFVNPHASKEECNKWIREDLVYGCGKPFIFDGKKVEICGYI
tara:strand:- start:291 stop:551 length:261 start_codon:yes stop_codon:yes gene_type:complete